MSILSRKQLEESCTGCFQSTDFAQAMGKNIVLCACIDSMNGVEAAQDFTFEDVIGFIPVNVLVLYSVDWAAILWPGMLTAL